jgi:HEAT repeat protein
MSNSGLDHSSSEAPNIASTSAVPSLEALIQQFQEGNFQTRWETAKQLIRFGPAIISPLSQLLKPEPSSQLDQVDQDHVPIPDPELAWFIAHTLAELEHPTTLDALSQLLVYPENDVKLQAAQALARLGEAALPTLASHLAETSTRLMAVQILGQIDDDQALPLMMSVADDANPQVREAMLTALGYFVNIDRFELVLPIGLKALKDPVATVRNAAINTLGRGATVTAPLPQWQPQLHDLVQQLLASLWDINLDVTQQAALTLGRIATPAATQALQERLLETAEPALVVKIIQALVWIGTPQSLGILQQALMTLVNPSIQQEIVAGLGRSHPPHQAQATEILLAFLTQSPADPQNPGGAIPKPLLQTIVHSLGRLGQPQALDPLIALLATPHTGTQFHIIAALKQLDATVSHQRLQSQSQATDLSNQLQQGIRLALQEW